MKKIMFNDMYGLTQAVLEGRKTMTRRITIQPPYENYEISFPTPDIAFDENHPLSEAFCRVNKDNKEEHTEWVRPQWKTGEVVAIAQPYKDICFENDPSGYPNNAGKTNKMFVRADLMPHRIQITRVQLQRLQNISNEDCLKEGVVEDILRIGDTCLKKYHPSPAHVKAMKDAGWGVVRDTPKIAFAELIDRVSGENTWNKNPWVFAYTFKLIK